MFKITKEPLASEVILVSILLSAITALCGLLVGCFLAAPYVPNPNFIYWCLVSAGVLLFNVSYLAVKFQKCQQLYNKFIGD